MKKETKKRETKKGKSAEIQEHKETQYKRQNVLQFCTHSFAWLQHQINSLLRPSAMWPLSVMTSVLYRPYLTTLQMAKEYPMLTHRIHMVYLPTLTIKLNKMEVHIPFPWILWVITGRGPLCTTRGYCLFLAESSICPARSTENLLGSDRGRHWKF